MADGFLSWFFAFFTDMLEGIRRMFGGIFSGIVTLFDIPSHLAQFRLYCDQFGALDWILAILALLLTYALLALLVGIAVLGIRKYLRARRARIGREEMLGEIARLSEQVECLTREKEALLRMRTDLTPRPMSANEAEAKEKTLGEVGRFCHLCEIDRRYADGAPTVARCGVSLAELCDNFRHFACSRLQLYYEPRTVRLMFAGLATTHLILLEGISGTGKTSLPYAIGKFFGYDATIASVQPSWRDRTELFGYFNEFTQKFNETEVLRRIYEASYREDVNLIVLDEMNIARVEYYFAEMLSILEMPDPAEWRIELVPSVREGDPKRLTDGKLTLPPNVWYVGTANHDDTTYAIADKVYDRAISIHLDTKGIAFEAPDTPPMPIAAAKLEAMFAEARERFPVSAESLARIEELDGYLIEYFRISFGNRILRQIQDFVPVYVACGGDEVGGIDYLLMTKVLRKLESLNLAMIRDELDGLIDLLDQLFGPGRMRECETYLERLKKMI